MLATSLQDTIRKSIHQDEIGYVHPGHVFCNVRHLINIPQVSCRFNLLSVCVSSPLMLKKYLTVNFYL